MAATQPGAPPGGPGRGGRIAAAIRRRPALAFAGIGGAVVVVVALARRHAAAAAAQGSTGAPVVFPGAGGGTQGGPSPSAGLENQMRTLQNLLNREERQIRQLQRKPGRQKTDRQRARVHWQGGLTPGPRRPPGGRRSGGTSRTGGRIR